MNPVPVMVTVVPPLVVPDVGVSEVMVGVGAMILVVARRVAVPPAVVTLTLTAPATWALVMALRVVGDVTVKLVAVVVPNWTAVAPIRFVPVMVTVVPPLVVPDVGVNEEMLGAEALNV